jgi:hypothetical protein
MANETRVTVRIEQGRLRRRSGSLQSPPKPCFILTSSSVLYVIKVSLQRAESGFDSPFQRHPRLSARPVILRGSNDELVHRRHHSAAPPRPITNRSTCRKSPTRKETFLELLNQWRVRLVSVTVALLLNRLYYARLEYQSPLLNCPGFGDTVSARFLLSSSSAAAYACLTTP